MTSRLKKFFLWIKDHFQLLVSVVLRLRIGVKKENPSLGSNPESNDEDSQNGERQ